MSTRSLSQTEAEQRAALLTVQRYDIEMDLTGLLTGPEVRCVSTVTFSCTEPGAETFVDCAAEVVSATLNGVPLDAASDDWIALPGLAADNVLRVESVQANTAEGEGVHKALDPADGEIYLWTSFEPDEARHVWACFDQPDLKAPHAFTVTAPTAWTVASNSADPTIETVEGSVPARRWTFPATPTLAAYNTVVNAGPFHEIRREVDGYDLGILGRRSMAPVLERDADEIFEVTAQGLGFFGRVFDMPFPQRKYDQVFMPEFGGAMENYGCVTWSDAILRWTSPTPAEREFFALILLHEMAHMWFGNIVTMRWWDDLWLNEAFAEFAAHWAAVGATSYTDVWASHLAGDELQAYLTDQGPISHPIRQRVNDVAEAASTFDAITYSKGASVLHQLMSYVGEEQFSAGMAAYFAEHAWENTTLQDLIDALAATSGRDLNRWRTAWLETAGPDRLGLEVGSDELVLLARGPAGPPRPQVLAVGAYSRRDEGGSLERTGLAEVDVSGERTPVDLPLGADFYLVNDEDLTFATARLESTAKTSVFAAASTLPSPISRGVAVAMVWDMLMSGEAAAAEVVDSLNAVLLAETAGPVVESYLTLAGDAAERWAPESERPALSAAVAATCRELVKDDARRQVALRTFARMAADLDEIGWLQAEAGDDVDLQWRALVRKSALGGDTSDEVARLVKKDPDPEAWIQALAVSAARPDAAAKEAVWQKIVVDHAVPVGSFRVVSAAFSSPGQDDLLAPYAERYLELLPQLHRGGMIAAMVYTSRLFPLFGIDEGFVDQAVQRAEGAAPVVRQTLLEQADLVRRMIRSRG